MSAADRNGEAQSGAAPSGEAQSGAGRGGDQGSAAGAITVSARTIVEGSFDSAGIAQLDTVYDVGLALSVPEQTIRLALRRMQAAGELVQVGRGRAGRIERSPDALRRTIRDAAMLDFAFAQDGGALAWDGLWHLYAFSVPETARADRDALRNALILLGTASVAPGMYVSPHDIGADIDDPHAADAAARWLVSATTSDLTLPGCSSPAEIAERLWPSAPTLAAYEPLARLLSTGPTRGATDEISVTAHALQLAEGLKQGLTADPLLPNELRSAPWPPQQVRQEFLETWQALERRHPQLSVFA